MIRAYCSNILGVQVDLSQMERGEIYYFKAEKSVKKVHEYKQYKDMYEKENLEFVKVDSVGQNSILSSYLLDNNNDEDDVKLYSYLVFIINGCDLRSGNIKHERAMQLLMITSNLFVMCIKKAEKGINLRDFVFLNRLFECAHIQENYEGTEKYKQFYAGFLLIYFDYHKIVRIAEMNDYFKIKLESRKANKLDQYINMKEGIKNKLPYIGFHSITKANVIDKNFE